MGSVPAPATRSFVALNGSEIKKAILADIERQLNADFHFSQHLSYALVIWNGVVAIDAYPHEIQPFQAKFGGMIAPPDAREVMTGETAEKIDLKFSRNITAGSGEGQSADSLRRETGQPVPITKTVGGPGGERITVEVPQIPQAPRESEEVRHERPSLTDVAGTKGVVARRATLKTNAAPDGVQVAPTAGSAPTAEDAEKIIERGLEDGTLEERK